MNSKKYKQKPVAGIYEIYNKRTDKYYIGKSNDVFGRWFSHMTGLFYKTHHNKYMLVDMEEGHYSDWCFRVIKIMSKHKLVDAEKVFIQNYKDSGKTLYKIGRAHV